LVNLSQLLESAYEWASDISGGRLQVLRRTIERFGEVRAAQAAAALAYYAVFSLFPLLLVLVTVTSFFVADERAWQEVIDFAVAAIPVSRDLISRNVQTVLKMRGAVGIVGLVGLLWSASGVFTVLAHNVNRAWPGAEPRSFLKRRLLGFAMIGTLALFLGLSLGSSAVLNLLPRLQVPLWGGIYIYETALWGVVSRGIPWLFTFLLFWGLYLWVPNAEVERRAALWGAVAAAVAWEIVKNIFVWFLGSGLVRYELVYGSLGAVVALMLWIYLGNWIILFGAHLSAAIAERRRAES
jgi:membrane protein